ncbi:amidohydrolase [Solirubrobacter sp. CPCC 204708]|uniref:Amidohydrolase n=1 Tax=Solirubrobacter deserti TaxID=2282478 RepID=A0ABT4RBL4_9ACTN|nr:amidohydrolase [Solirubrobacter deserti]MBE2317185.1 amidohydrolase [Solirubrobacter deserti]MDA0135922.1 amidohydrolase [Solirubrobacter deserti]
MPADLAIIEAWVRTLDPERPFTHAVAMKDGLIVALGDDVRAACDAKTHVIDARGAALVPGLVDSHLHPFWGAELARGVDLSACRTPADTLTALRAGKPQRGWLFGWGLDYDAAPTPAQLEDALPGVAVFVRMMDMHTALATPTALRYAQVTGTETFSDNSAVVVDEDGVPTGELREGAAHDLVLRAAPRLRWPDLRARHVENLRRLNALGLTGAHVMDGDLATHELLRDLEGTGELSLRLRVPHWIQPDMSDRHIELLLGTRDARGELWTGGVAKFFADGVIDAGTAWLEAPDTHGEGITPFWPDPERMADVMKRFADAGFQLATHTIGDAAARFTLGAYLRAGAAPGVRHRLEHLEAIPDDLVQSIPRAGVVASMQPVHLAALRGDGSGNWNERLGPERAARAFRMRDLLDAGAVLTLGSDWPVADADPRLGLAAAQLRRVPSTPEALAVRPDQALTAEEALAGYTTVPALVAGESLVAGRIREGMRADLTGLAVDPVELPAAQLPDNPVWLTVVGGRVVHQTDDNQASTSSGVRSRTTLSPA